MRSEARYPLTKRRILTDSVPKTWYTRKFRFCLFLCSLSAIGRKQTKQCRANSPTSHSPPPTRRMHHGKKDIHRFKFRKNVKWKKKLKIFSSCCVVAGTKIYMEQFVWCAVELHFLLPHTEQICRLCVSGERVAIGGGGNGKQRKKNFISSSFHFLPTKSMCWEVRAKIFRGRKKKKFFFRESGSKWWKHCFASISGGWVAKVQPTEVPLDRALITRPPKTGWKINVLTFWKIFAHRTPQNPLNSAIQLCPLCPWPGPHNNSLPDWDESTTPR